MRSKRATRRKQAATLVVALLGTWLTCRAEPEQPVAPPAHVQAGVRPQTHGQGLQRTAAQRLEADVRHLTTGLNLDSEQQEKIRRILIDQHLQLLKLRTSAVPAGFDHTGAIMAIMAQTKERIRGVLNLEQRTKYSTDTPGQTGASRADLEHWLEIRDKKNKGAS